MAEHRKYTKRQKLSAVLAAEMVGVTAAGEQSGIPKTTIQYWLDDPKFAPFRTKVREDLADEVKVVAHLAWKRVAEALESGDMEPRDALFAADKASSLQLLMSGEATSRSESKDLTRGLDATTRERISTWFDQHVATDARATDGVPDGDRTEVR